MRLINRAIAGTLVMGSFFSSCEIGSKEVPPSKPNIIFFLVDDMGWQDTSLPFWKERTPFNQKFHTPNMERLASVGMKFTQAYACSVCTPTRVSLMTGMNAARHRVTDWTLRRNETYDMKDDILEFPKWNCNGLQPEDVDSIERSVSATTLVQILKTNGYFTIHCGKAHWGTENTPGANPLNLGFDINIAGHCAGGVGSFMGIHNFSAAWRNGDRIWDVPGLDKYHGKNIHLTDALTQEAESALDRALNIGKPFYLCMSHYAVHTPLEPEKPFYQKYKEIGLEEPEACYASMVEGMDKSLGYLMDYLEAKGIADNTVILFMSDNGGKCDVPARGGIPYQTNLPLNAGKRSAYESGVHVPMIVKWPGTVMPNTVCDNQEGAAKGYNTTKKGAKSYHPLLVFVSEMKLLYHTWFRTGSAYTSNGIVGLLQEVKTSLPSTIKSVFFRADSGFFSGELFDLLESFTWDYLVKVKPKNLDIYKQRFTSETWIE